MEPQKSRRSIAQKTCSTGYCTQLQTVPQRRLNIMTCSLTVTKNRTVWDSIDMLCVLLLGLKQPLKNLV